MGWFDEQIKQRKLSDENLFDESFASLADIVNNKRRQQDEAYADDIREILKYYGFSTKVEVPRQVTDFYDQLEYLCRPVGLMYRDVKLTENWYKDAIGAFLGFRKDDGSTVAIIPGAFGYRFLIDGKYEKVTKKNCTLIKEDAICFYKPFPLRKLNLKDLVVYSIGTRTVGDIISILSFMGISTLIGLLLPKLSYFMYSEVIESKSISLLVSTITFYLCVQISKTLFETFKQVYNEKINTKMSISIQAATMMRILALPANFFRKYSSGELSSRSSYVSSLCSTLMGTIFSTGLTSVFSLAYVASIFNYAPGLVVPSLIIIIISISFSIVSSLVQTKISKDRMETGNKLSGMAYATVTGIQKIRLAGAEKRAFARWSRLFGQSASDTYNPPLFIRINGVISQIISIAGTFMMYSLAIRYHLSVAEYNAFNTAYGMVYGSFSSLASIALTIANIKPTIDMAKPIMDAEPEISEGKEILTGLKGNIEISNVSFRYEEDQPNVIDDLTLKIKAGEYVAIVGKTGCGKSTLIRLLLGFEKADKGTVYYDGKDINSVDLKSLRRKIGVVMQDGKLFQGDIYSNIVISAPELSLNEAWEAAELSGIADDIRRMPMGMNTVISEGSGGISGGQRQRLMIARAVAPKPKILIFDEATSALDNITQRKVSDALDKLNCTRIVIAHRLSTIKHCDRILYLEDGKIKEEGTYEELIAQNGLFAALVERQRLED